MSKEKPIADFYDDFLEKRMLSYRVDGNLRLELAKEFVLRFIEGNCKVADIGCGIGIVSEAVAKSNRSNEVVGIDLSEANINYAKSTAREPNLEFKTASVTEQFDVLRTWGGGSFDRVILTDVIEHIPESDREQLLRDIADVCSGDALLLLTYPSPEYQEFLYDSRREELQIIDNLVSISDLMEEAKNSGWRLKYFAYVDAWMQNQYCHAVFSKHNSLQSQTENHDANPLARAWASLRRATVRRYKVRKYRQ